MTQYEESLLHRAHLLWSELRDYRYSEVRSAEISREADLIKVELKEELMRCQVEIGRPLHLCACGRIFVHEEFCTCGIRTSVDFQNWYDFINLNTDPKIVDFSQYRLTRPSQR